jgi:GNAT superfamily N-acetyltransferase
VERIRSSAATSYQCVEPTLPKSTCRTGIWPFRQLHFLFVTTQSRLTARPVEPDDRAFLLEAVRSVQPHHPWTEEQLQTYWQTAEMMGEVRRFVIDEGGRGIGWAAVLKRHDAPVGEGRLWTFLPNAGVERLGRAWELAEGAAAEIGIRLAQANVWEDDEAGVAVLRDRGWEQKRRERFWRLELDGQHGRLVALRDAALRRVEAAGLRIVTADQLGGAAIYPELYRIDEVTSADIPRDLPHVPVAYEVWLAWVRPPHVLPERLWVAVSDGRPVGMSYLAFDATPVSTGYTGVLREHRGAGIARALKLQTLVQAIELGVDAVETDNDSQNAPILHLNEELGYHEIPGILRLQKTLA